MSVRHNDRLAVIGSYFLSRLPGPVMVIRCVNRARAQLIWAAGRLVGRCVTENRPSRSGLLWRISITALSVVVAAGTGVVTNLITNRWSLALAVGLGLLVLAGIVIQLVQTPWREQGEGAPGGHRAPSQIASAGRDATVIQAGRDVHLGGLGSVVPDAGRSGEVE
ncbi:hypothetical protein Q5425_03200 [Amycolatopsis sp. A133]|uniref:hypothetical protein n=1 Tax=Amycolatopsis sp. A133 TaxID=3064472 RepID=UPI0027EA7BD9|nr:hypothetical protein [Amycolatopsis sp. A133]MDQ7802721.1 hypothetical protein [Amycolatopsis sp. A133]